VYNLKFIAWQGTFASNSKEELFTVTIENPCRDDPAHSLASTSIPNQAYVLTKAKVEITVPSFISSPSYCKVDYILETQDGSALDAEVIQFDPLTRVITIEYLDFVNFAAKAKQHLLKVTGQSSS